ncbi:protein of unknown function [Thiomonas sp. OC7]|nr:protein of unknown function [Thiomonas sp. OC7]
MSCNPQSELQCSSLYVSFGSDWWPYALRRIGESQENAWQLARSLLGGS